MFVIICLQILSCIHLQGSYREKDINLEDFLKDPSLHDGRSYRFADYIKSKTQQCESDVKKPLKASPNQDNVDPNIILKRMVQAGLTIDEVFDYWENSSLPCITVDMIVAMKAQKKPSMQVDKQLISSQNASSITVPEKKYKDLLAKKLKDDDFALKYIEHGLSSEQRELLQEMSESESSLWGFDTLRRALLKKK